MNADITQQQVDAKAHLSYMIGCYTFLADRVVLDENRKNKEFLHYLNDLLPQANALANADGYLSASEYEDMENTLEDSWYKWRMQMPISKGIIEYSQKIIESAGDEKSYSPELWKKFCEGLVPAQTMIDNLKNSTIATDAQGKTALGALQGLVDGLKNGRFQSTEAMQAKLMVMDHIEGYTFQAARDTKPQKSAETVELLALIEKAKALVCDTDATEADYTGIKEQMYSYFNDSFLPGLCLGKALKERARKLYYSAAKDAHLYTAESFNTVSDAINKIDEKADAVYDYECTALLNELEKSIESLELKQAKTANVTLSCTENDDCITVFVNVNGGLDLIYGNFNLFYDEKLVEYTASSCAVKLGKNSVFFRLDATDSPINESGTIAQITFAVKSAAKRSPFCISCSKLREKDGSLLKTKTPPLHKTGDSCSVSFDGKTQKAKKFQLLPLPCSVPVKKNFVFDGWYVDGKKIINELFVTESCDATPVFKPCKYGPLGKDDISMGAWMAIHGHFAVEEDFKLLAENGIEFILMDYVHGEHQFKDQLYWAEKYGVRAYLHDYNLNAIDSPTVEEILSYTADYSKSPVFLGNDVIDEPSANVMRKLSSRTENYKKAFPDYDMHINLLPNYTFGTEATFEEYVQAYIDNIHADHISTDVYPLMNINGKKVTKANYFEGVYHTAKTARDNKLSHWVYIQLLTGMDHRAPDMVDLRFQAYVCLAFGAGKIMYYTYDVPGYSGTKKYNREVYGMRDYAHEYTELWDYAQLVNEEITSYAELYKNYTYADSYTLRAGQIPAYVAYVPEYNGKDLEIISDQSLLIGEFNKKDGNGKMFIIANASEPSSRLCANVQIKTATNTPLKAVVRGEEADASSLKLKSGAGAMILL